MLVFVVLLIVLSVAMVSMLGKINKKFLVYQPEAGGSITEGVVGSPRFVNPVLAISDTDRDLVALIYSGLMRKTETGEIIPDLAESYEVTPDGLNYTFHLRANAEFHDHTPVTADDVVFTVEKVKDPTIKSPLEAIWQGIVVEKGDDNQTVIFRLSESYASFLDNATLGIIPRHVWERFNPEEFNLAELNLRAVGAGPYKISDINDRKNGRVEEYELSTWSGYAGTKPYIRHVNLTFFKNEDELVKAFRRGRVDQVSAVSPRIGKTLADEGFTPTTATLSRIFGLFFNPNQNEILRDKNVARAIDLAIDKDSIVKNVLYGFGEVINSPVPSALLDQPVGPEDPVAALESAKSVLDSAGWKVNAESGFREKGGKVLEFSISTADVAELRAAAQMVKDDLADAGMNVSIKVFETGMLNQNVIRPREYEALLFGQVVRNESDLFAFWHSSQRNDPGLNISVYTNNKVDKILEDLVKAVNQSDKQAKLNEFVTNIHDDMPAVFLYAPKFIYMEGDRVEGVSLGRMTNASERFLSVRSWYTRTDAVWKFFTKPIN